LREPTRSSDIYTNLFVKEREREVATVSKIDKIIGLFCKRDL